MAIKDDLCEIVDKERIYCDEPMKNHTSFKIGGPADFFVVLKNINELKKIIEYTSDNNVGFMVVGNGTNLLVTDKGIRGVVAKLDFNKIDINKETTTISVSGDYPISKLARECAIYGLKGAEFLAGIPGTVGGAVVMNAGAFEREIKDINISTTALNIKTNEIKTFTNEEQQFEYRNSFFKGNDYIILEATFKFENGNQEDIILKMDEIMSIRAEKQPLEFPSAGSTFKRGNGFITAKLIDECGLKGKTIGGAMISNKHAGFIVNTGNATCRDVLDLIDIIEKEVYQRFNERIELEVIVVGDN